MSLGKSAVLRASLSCFVAALAMSQVACGSWVSVRRVASAQRKPNNVWVFVSVDRALDVPVEGLALDDFTVYEDGSPSPASATKLVLQAPDAAAAMYTLLLVDMSATTSPADAEVLVDAAKSFAERMSKTQKVAVFLFDGADKLTPVVPFADGKPVTPPTPATFEAMRRYKTKDPSTNLNGAVVEGLRELRRALDRDRKPLKLGTLVVMAEGGDRAGRVSRDDLRKELDDVKYEDAQVLGVAVRADRSYLDDAARDGVELAPSRSGFASALDRVASKIQSHEKRYYLLSFCTAARKGEHEVKVEARVRNPEGTGSLSYTFTAEGLGPPPDCDTRTAPPSDLKTARAEERERGRQSDRDKPSDKASKGGQAAPVTPSGPETQPSTHP